MKNFFKSILFTSLRLLAPALVFNCLTTLPLMASGFTQQDCTKSLQDKGISCGKFPILSQTIPTLKDETQRCMIVAGITCQDSSKKIAIAPDTGFFWNPLNSDVIFMQNNDADTGYILSKQKKKPENK